MTLLDFLYVFLYRNFITGMWCGVDNIHIKNSANLISAPPFHLHSNTYYAFVVPNHKRLNEFARGYLYYSCS